MAATTNFVSGEITLLGSKQLAAKNTLFHLVNSRMMGTHATSTAFGTKYPKYMGMYDPFLDTYRFI